MIFQNAMPVFVSRGTILNYKQGDFVLEKKIFATLVNYTQQTEDIVQGLPKIEELVEARRPKVKSYLANRPGIVLHNSFVVERSQTLLSSSVLKCVFNSVKETEVIKKVRASSKKKPEKQKQEKQIIAISHSIYLNHEIVVYNNIIYRAIPVPTIFVPVRKKKTGTGTGINTEFLFRNVIENLETKELESYENDILLIDNKLKFSTWKKENVISINKVYKYKNEKLTEWISIQNICFVNSKRDYIVKTEESKYIFLEQLNPAEMYKIPLTSKVLFEPGNFIDIGEPITEGTIDVHELLNLLFKYHLVLDGTMLGTLRTLAKFQLLLVNSVQSIYQSQGVSISSKHIEIIVRQMTAKVVIKESGDTPLLPGEIVRLSQMNEIYEALQSDNFFIRYKTPKYEPFLISATNASLGKDGFLSAAGFQETKRVLTRAAIEGSADWLRGLKECIIIGRLIPAGSAFLNYKSYLDNVYLFKEI